MKRYLLILLLSSLCLPAFAAGPLKVTGRVKDARTGDPVPGAVVQLDDNYLWAVTGEDGAFELKGAEKGTYTLSVSLGEPDGTPRLALPLKNGRDRRYPVCKIVVR